MTTYSGGKKFLDQERYVRESKEDEGENCDLGEKIELVTDMGRSDTYGKTAEVSSQKLGAIMIV